MAHPRKLIRAQAVARLLPIEALGGRVYPGRLIPLRADALPACCVYTLRNSARREGALTQPTFLDTCTLAVELYVRASSTDCEDEIDDLVEQVENSLLQDPTFKRDCGIEHFDGIETNYKAAQKGDGDYIAAQLAFDIQFRTTFPPNNATADFKGINLALKPIDPRDPNLPFPPAEWRLSPFARFDVPTA